MSKGARRIRRAPVSCVWRWRHGSPGKFPAPEAEPGLRKRNSGLAFGAIEVGGHVMGPEAVRHAAVMLAAGIGIPVLAALNAQLGARIGSPVAAGVVLFCVALLGAITVMVLSGSVSALARVPGQPGHLFLAGLLVAFYVLSITFVAPRFGVGNAIFFVLLGQMVSAAVIDQFGLFGAMVRPLTMLRLGGIGLMLAGLFLIQRG